ncbi:hypothetical protein UFOVP1382_184 [uncultured Caudovirales phage]|uniref:Uncharacterized protein n=1 Tax=uncultured Caudovirales phage TaxID=2100421 RepID=A0A6J5S5B8_9CAUD|nr:hypothetical protein UFOVP1382_184 [uncultured Caudovirales phage]
MGSHRITPDQTSFFKPSCRVATTSNVSNFASPPASVDGVTLASGDLVLVKHQTDKTKNGIYVHGAAWARASFASRGTDVANGVSTWVMDGAQNGGRRFRFASPDPVTVGADEILIEGDGQAALVKVDILHFDDGKGNPAAPSFVPSGYYPDLPALLPAGVPHILITQGFAGFSQYAQPPNNWVGPSPWDVDNARTTITSNGLVGTGALTSKGAWRVGRGTYYCEFEFITSTGSLSGVGFTPSGEGLQYDHVVGKGMSEVAYLSDGSIMVANAIVASGLDPLLDGYVLGVVLEFKNADSPTFIGGANGWEAAAYFAVEGAWQNGADPVAGTGGTVFSDDFSARFAMTASLHDSCIANADIVITEGSIVDGDYIEVAGIPIGLNCAYRISMTPITGGSPGDTLVFDVGSPATTCTLTAVSGARTSSSNDFDVTILDQALLLAEIIAAINDPANMFFGLVTASSSGTKLIIEADTLTLADGTMGAPVVDAMFTNSRRIDFTSYPAPGYAGQSISNALADPQGSFTSMLTAGFPDGDTIHMYAAGPGTAGNSITLSTNNVVAFNMPANFSGGAVAPVIKMVSDPSAPWLHAPGGAEIPFYTVGPETTSEPLYAGCPSPTIPTPTDFDLIQTPGIPYSMIGFARSIQLRTDASYDGGPIDMTIIRADTLETVTRTVTPQVGGGVVRLDIPVLALMRVTNSSHGYTAGSFYVERGPLWAPFTMPCSVMQGVNVPARIASAPPPRLVIDDLNSGAFVEFPDIAGEDMNMLDMESLTHGPSPHGDRKVIIGHVYYEVINAQ